MTNMCCPPITVQVSSYWLDKHILMGHLFPYFKMDQHGRPIFSYIVKPVQWNMTANVQSEKEAMEVVNLSALEW